MSIDGRVEFLKRFEVCLRKSYILKFLIFALDFPYYFERDELGILHVKMLFGPVIGIGLALYVEELRRISTGQTLLGECNGFLVTPEPNIVANSHLRRSTLQTS